MGRGMLKFRVVDRTGSGTGLEVVCQVDMARLEDGPSSSEGAPGAAFEGSRREEKRSEETSGNMEIEGEFGRVVLPPLWEGLGDRRCPLARGRAWASQQ